MGLITGILTLPLAPVRGVAWIGERVQEQAEAEFYDENRIMSELTERKTAAQAVVFADRSFVDERIEVRPRRINRRRPRGGA